MVRIVDIRLDSMIDTDTEPLLDKSRLQEAPLDTMHWSTQSSGIHIPVPVAQALEYLWELHIQQLGCSRSD